METFLARDRRDAGFFIGVKDLRGDRGSQNGRAEARAEEGGEAGQDGAEGGAEAKGLGHGPDIFARPMPDGFGLYRGLKLVARYPRDGT